MGTVLCGLCGLIVCPGTCWEKLHSMQLLGDDEEGGEVEDEVLAVEFSHPSG